MACGGVGVSGSSLEILQRHQETRYKLGNDPTWQWRGRCFLLHIAAALPPEESSEIKSD